MIQKYQSSTNTWVISGQSRNLDQKLQEASQTDALIRGRFWVLGEYTGVGRFEKLVSFLQEIVALKIQSIDSKSKVGLGDWEVKAAATCLRSQFFVSPPSFGVISCRDSSGRRREWSPFAIRRDYLPRKTLTSL